MFQHDRILGWWTPPRLAGTALLAVGLAASLAIPWAGSAHPLIGIAGRFGAFLADELLAIGLLTLVLDWVIGYQITERRKLDLIIQLASSDNVAALQAVHYLRAAGWLTDGALAGAELWQANLAEAPLDKACLRNARLHNANLESADLHNADLSGARLRDANLNGAELSGARLVRARLEFADLREASLVNADISGADLKRANLEGADLSYTLLTGANLAEAVLQGADLSHSRLTDASISEEQLRQASCLWSATLPDGTRYDGRYSLVGDREMARLGGVDITDPEAMRRWYAGGDG